MTDRQINPVTLTKIANCIGKEKGVRCIYKMFDNKFTWVYYRSGVRIGLTRDSAKVIKLMSKYCEVR